MWSFACQVLLYPIVRGFLLGWRLVRIQENGFPLSNHIKLQIFCKTIIFITFLLDIRLFPCLRAKVKVDYFITIIHYIHFGLYLIINFPNNFGLYLTIRFPITLDLITWLNLASYSKVLEQFNYLLQLNVGLSMAG